MKQEAEQRQASPVEPSSPLKQRSVANEPVVIAVVVLGELAVPRVVEMAASAVVVLEASWHCPFCWAL